MIVVAIDIGGTFTDLIGFDAAVSLSVDGLNMFSFSEEGRVFNLLIPKRESRDIPGWFITKKQTALFQVQDYGGTPAAKLLVQPPHVGTIVAVFGRAYTKDDSIPDDELALKARMNQSGTLATGLGRRIEFQYRTEERFLGAVRSTICIRYERPQK